MEAARRDNGSQPNSLFNKPIGVTSRKKTIAKTIGVVMKPKAAANAIHALFGYTRALGNAIARKTNSKPSGRVRSATEISFPL
jgi:hypothetical protein